MYEICINIYFSTAEINSHNIFIPTQPADKLVDKFMDHFEQELLYAHNPTTTDAERIQNMLESKYCSADLEGIAKEFKLLSKTKQEKLFLLLNKFVHLFNGMLGS
jgi:hypothetical protein